MDNLTLPKYIKELSLRDIEANLFFYKYDNRNIKSIIKRNVSEEDISYISAYNSIRGEIYENIIYELLLKFALENTFITRFILKGPYQNKENHFIKSGLLIDRSSQIVYKSSYKDISEFDALFFTKNSVYFVEITTSKKTSSLNKRLAKKYALLKVIFPSLEIKALIIVTKGSVGLRNFPKYSDIWVTKDLDDEKLIRKIIHSKRKNANQKHLNKPNNKKFIEAYKVRYKKFQYFPTLEWILEKSRSNQKFIVDLKFFSSYQLSLYFDIYTKLYIGYLSTEEFIKIYPEFDLEAVENRIIVTLEKVNQTQLDIIYYVKETNGKLKRIRLQGNNISIKEKDPEGFTNAEVRFFSKVFTPKHILYLNNINHILKHLSLIKV